MLNRNLLKVALILSLFSLPFFANAGYTIANTEQLPSSDATAQNSTTPAANPVGAKTTTQAAVTTEPIIKNNLVISSWSFPNVATEGNTGAAISSFTLETPPGRKGVQPNLAFQYNSNARNGWIGVGWNIPISFIQRNTKYGVNYNASDYVHDDEELTARGDWGTNCFGKKIEGDFSKYYYNSGTSGWEVTSKDGTKYYYGTTNASRQDNTYGVFKWMLDKVQDTNGNYMTVSYWKDQGGIYIDRMDYTGNGNQNPTNCVQFYHEARTDAPSQWISNVEVKTAYRLKTVDVVANGSRVRVYTLSYTMSGSTGQSLLVGMQQYGTDATLDTNGTVTGGSLLPMIALDYSTMLTPNNINWNEKNNSSPDVGTQIAVGDFDGDGKNDLYYYYNSHSYVGKYDGNQNIIWSDWGSGIVYTANSEMVVGDFDGDGKSDIVFKNDNNDYFLISTGTAFSYNYYQHPTNRYGERLFAGDLDGDGKTELIQYDNDLKINQFKVNIIKDSNNNVTALSLTRYYKGEANGGELLIGDFNGDGKSDMAFLVGNIDTGLCYLSVDTDGLNYNLLHLQDWGNFNLTSSGGETIVGDFNGDGKQDILMYTTIDRIFKVGLSTGAIFEWRQWTNPNIYAGFGLFHVGDFNGDGKSDLFFYLDKNAEYTGLSNGSDFNWYGRGADWGTVSNRFRVGDFNGDGKSDLYFKATNSHNNDDLLGLVPSTTANCQIPDKLTSLSNGIGGVTTIQYQPSSCYTNLFLPFIAQAVSSITVNDGNGNVSTNNYTYSGGLYTVPNREFRGFQYVKTTDPAGSTTETGFKQDDIFKGLPYTMVTKDAAGNIYNRIDNTFQPTSPYTGVTFPYLSRKDDYFYDGTTTWKQTATEFTYDGYGNITQKYFRGDEAASGDEMYESTDYAYDTANWILSLPTSAYVLDNNGICKAKTSFTYYTNGNLQTVTKYANWNPGGTNPVTSYTYNNYGNCKTVTDPMNNVTTITYDNTQTYPHKTTNALNQVTTTLYDKRFGKMTSKTDPYNNKTTYEYDVFGRPSKVTNPLDTASYYGTVSYEYSNFGSVDNQCVRTYNTVDNGTSNNLWEEVYFDGLGRTILTKREGPDGKVIAETTTYNQRGLVATQTLPYFIGNAQQNTTFEYDPVGRVTRTTNPDGTYTQTIYRKWRTAFIDANDHKRLEEKDAYGRLISVEEYTGASGNYNLYATTSYGYNVLGNLVTVTDALSNQTTMVYDSLGRKTSMTDPDMGTWTYTYDLNGNLKTQTDAKVQAIQFSYDVLNRVTLKDYPTGVDVSYAYDETTINGTMKTVLITDASGTTKSYFDQLGRVTKVIKTVDGVSYTTETTYNDLGKITSIKYPDNDVVTYTYDSGGNLYQVVGYVTYTNYNALGQAQNVGYGNGVTTSYQYYPQNYRLFSISTVKGTQGLINQSYSYDNAGNVMGITDSINSNRTRTFNYDDLNRLKKETCVATGTLTYTYNKIGNILSKEGVTYTYGSKPHAVSSTSDGKTYVYDANGNMINDSQRAIMYNYDNMPASLNYNGATTQFVYDGQGGRVKKTSGTTSIAYIGKWYEVVNSGASSYKYIFAGGARIARKGASATHYYHQDHLGSSSVITDASGNKVEDIFYLPFGVAQTDTNAALTTHKFTGQELDAETGLYYYGARYYNPQLGRFISADTIVGTPGDPQDLNRYTYAGNNPLLYTDPTGHFKFSTFLKAVASGVAGGAAFYFSGGNPMVAGMVAGAVSGAMTGKAKNVFFGAVTGGLLGAYGGAASGAFGPAGAYSMLAAGVGMAYYKGGMDGVAYLGGGMLGGYIGYKTTPYMQNAVGGYGLKSHNDVIETLSQEGKCEEAIAFAAKRYGIPLGPYDTNDPALGLESGTTAETNMITGKVKYGPLAFSERSMLQNAGFHEGVHVLQVNLDKVVWDFGLPDPMFNRYPLELEACGLTITNAWQLDLTGSVIQSHIEYYDYNALKARLPLWGQ